jgi:hypothetical protein
VLVSAGLALLVYAISEAPKVGWGTARTILLLIVVGRAPGRLPRQRAARERPVDAVPHLPRAHRCRSERRRLPARAVIFANFFLLTLYVQDVLHYSPLKTGFTFIATAGTAVLAAGVAQALTTRFGAKPIIVIGLALLTAAMVWYSQIP